MSKQLAISAAFSVLAMAAFVVFSTRADNGTVSTDRGATGYTASAPLLMEAPALPMLPLF